MTNRSRDEGLTPEITRRTVLGSGAGVAAVSILPIRSESMHMTFLHGWAPHILSILRILTAATFLTHGTMKLFAWPAPFPYPMNVMLYTAAILEVVGGLLLIVGLFSRPVAFVLSGLMAFAYFIGHGARGFFPVLNGGEAAMLFCFVFLYIAAAGPGAWSIDAATRRA